MSTTFNRTTRSVALSAEGEQFVGEIAPALAAIRTAMERIDEHRAEPAGTLRLNLPLAAGQMVLSPLISEYMRRYPRVAVDMVTEGAMVDIVGQGFDAGVRLEEFVPPDMIAVPITRPIRLIVVGSPAYFTGRKRPRTPADLLEHRCIRRRTGSGTIYRWEFEKRGEAVAIDVPGQLTLDDSDLMLLAALAGEGLAFLADIAAAKSIKAGLLLPILEDWSPEYPGLCLYYSESPQYSGPAARVHRTGSSKGRMIAHLLRAVPRKDRFGSIALRSGGGACRSPAGMKTGGVARQRLRTVTCLTPADHQL